jgi:hypothetical protein
MRVTNGSAPGVVALPDRWPVPPRPLRTAFVSSLPFLRRTPMATVGSASSGCSICVLRSGSCTSARGTSTLTMSALRSSDIFAETFTSPVASANVAPSALIGTPSFDAMIVAFAPMKRSPFIRPLADARNSPVPTFPVASSMRNVPVRSKRTFASSDVISSPSALT